MKTSIACLLTLLLVPPALAQERSREERRSEERSPEREGGIPREMVVPSDNRAEQEGTEEGSPSLRSEPGDRRVAPYVLPPERSEWKLGVYAHYTDTGVVVTRVVPGSPAQRVGLERGDRLVSINGYQVGWIRDRLYPLDAELQRQAGYDGQVLLLVQNVRNNQLLNIEVGLQRQGQPFPGLGRTRSRGNVAPVPEPDGPAVE